MRFTRINQTFVIILAVAVPNHICQGGGTWLGCGVSCKQGRRLLIVDVYSLCLLSFRQNSCSLQPCWYDAPESNRNELCTPNASDPPRSAFRSPAYQAAVDIAVRCLFHITNIKFDHIRTYIPYGKRVQHNVERDTRFRRGNRANKAPALKRRAAQPAAAHRSRRQVSGMCTVLLLLLDIRPLTLRSLVSSRTMATAPPYLATATRQRSRCRSSSSAQSRS